MWTSVGPVEIEQIAATHDALRALTAGSSQKTALCLLIGERAPLPQHPARDRAREMFTDLRNDLGAVVAVLPSVGLWRGAIINSFTAILRLTAGRGGFPFQASDSMDTAAEFLSKHLPNAPPLADLESSATHLQSALTDP